MSDDTWTVTTIMRGPGNLEHHGPFTIRSSDNMTVEDVKRERLKLAADIGVLITAFQERTGTKVKSVHLEHFLTDASDIPVKTEAEIVLEI